MLSRNNINQINSHKANQPKVKTIDQKKIPLQSLTPTQSNNTDTKVAHEYPSTSSQEIRASKSVSFKLDSAKDSTSRSEVRHGKYGIENMIQVFEPKSHNTATNAINCSELPNSNDLLKDLSPEINAFEEICNKLNSVPESTHTDYDEDVTGASSSTII